MKLWLYGAGVQPSQGWTARTIFHLEIKTTPSDCDEPFFVSQNQFHKVLLPPATTMVVINSIVYNISRCATTLMIRTTLISSSESPALTTTNRVSSCTLTPGVCT